MSPEPVVVKTARVVGKLIVGLYFGLTILFFAGVFLGPLFFGEEFGVALGWLTIFILMSPPTAVVWTTSLVAVGLCGLVVFGYAWMYPDPTAQPKSITHRVARGITIFCLVLYLLAVTPLSSMLGDIRLFASLIGQLGAFFAGLVWFLFALFRKG